MKINPAPTMKLTRRERTLLARLSRARGGRVPVSKVRFTLCALIRALHGRADAAPYGQ